MITNWFLTKLYTFKFNSLALELCDVSTEIEYHNRGLFFEAELATQYKKLVDRKNEIQSNMSYIREKLGL